MSRARNPFLVVDDATDEIVCRFARKIDAQAFVAARAFDGQRMHAEYVDPRLDLTCVGERIVEPENR